MIDYFSERVSRNNTQREKRHHTPLWREYPPYGERVCPIIDHIDHQSQKEGVS